MGGLRLPIVQPLAGKGPPIGQSLWKNRLTGGRKASGGLTTPFPEHGTRVTFPQRLHLDRTLLSHVPRQKTKLMDLNQEETKRLHRLKGAEVLSTICGGGKMYQRYNSTQL